MLCILFLFILLIRIYKYFKVYCIYLNIIRLFDIYNKYYLCRLYEKVIELNVWIIIKVIKNGYYNFVC